MPLDGLLPSVTGVVGIVIGAVMTGWQQRAITRVIIQSEFRKLSAQIQGESRAHFRATKNDRLLEVIPELIAATDPELQQNFDYNRIIRLLHRVQLMLNLDNPLESRINGRLNDLAFTVRAVKSGNASSDALLQSQSQLVESTGQYLNGS